MPFPPQKRNYFFIINKKDCRLPVKGHVLVVFHRLLKANNFNLPALSVSDKIYNALVIARRLILIIFAPFRKF